MLFTGKPVFLFFLALRCSLIFIKSMVIPCFNFSCTPGLCPLKTLWELSAELFYKTNAFYFFFPLIIFIPYSAFWQTPSRADLFTKLNLQSWDKLKILRQKNNKKSTVWAEAWLIFDQFDPALFPLLCLCLFPSLLVDLPKELKPIGLTATMPWVSPWLNPPNW